MAETKLSVPEKPKVVTSNGYACTIRRDVNNIYSAIIFIPSSHPVFALNQVYPEYKGVQWPTVRYQVALAELKDIGKYYMCLFNFDEFLKIPTLVTESPPKFEKVISPNQKGSTSYEFEDVMTVINQATKCAEAFATGELYSDPNFDKLLKTLNKSY